MTTYRLFIAIDLAAPVTEALVALQQTLRAAKPVRWTKPAQMHLTLQFLGDTPADKVPALEAALAEQVAPLPAFNLVACGLGVFPSLKRPRVIWAGLEGETAALQTLYQAVIRATQTVGFEPEDRPFAAHLTLGRTDRRARGGDYRRIGEVIEKQQPQVGRIAPMAVERVSLIRSQLKPGGPVYTILAEFPLRRSINPV